MPFSSCASTRQVSSSLMRRRVAERDDEADAVDIEAVDDGCGGSRGGGGRRQTACLPGSKGVSPGAEEGWCFIRHTQCQMARASCYIPGRQGSGDGRELIGFNPGCEAQSRIAVDGPQGRYTRCAQLQAPPPSS